ncbi:hypothetical protein B484DRAFT_408872 [Ochromonadaceae sp. CCMP2298]|nr:hypothetical protein B484DRAFT_408872 [Ochromonadaceae sp. CCMP2298]
MLAAVEKIKEQVGWASHSYHVAIQHRSWVEVKPFAPLRAESEARSLSCALEELRSLRRALPELRVLVYITSDDPLFAQKVARTLGALNVTFASSPLLDRRHSARHSEAEPRDVTVNVGLVDWFLVGEAAAALCTGTTFCTSARARTGVGRSDWGLVGGGVRGARGAGGVGEDSHRAPFDAFEKTQGNRQLLSQVTLVCPRAGTHVLYPTPTHMPMYNNSISRPDLPLPWFKSTAMEKSVKKGYVGKVWSAI